MLREALITLPDNSVEKFKAVTQVAEAETASKAKDGNKVLKHLKQGGNWVWKTANDVGTKLLVELLKKEMGL